MSFNPLERQLALWLAHFPALKTRLKYVYQATNRLLFRKSYKFQSVSEVAAVSSSKKENFFGYYDHSPLHIDNDLVIYHEANQTTSQAPQAHTSVDIVLDEIASGKEIFRHTSHAYNWQQGSKLMWLDSERFIFNDVQDQQLISRIVSLKDKEQQTIPFPIYDCKADFGVSLNFHRLTKFRPDYGYRSSGISVENSSFDDSKDGVFHIDFKTLERKLVISLQDLSQISKAAIQNQEQWVNHLMISPNGKKMMFLHRWLDNGVKKDALYVADIDGSALKCLSNEGMVSHCFWENNEQIIAYLRRQEKGDQYYRVHIESGSIKALPLPKTQVFGDGHPNVYKQWMLFDSYPDRSGMKKLWIFNLETNLLKELASFYEPLKYYAESRCDLHPRFSMDGKRVFFDSVHENKRRLYYMNMEENI